MKAVLLASIIGLSSTVGWAIDNQNALNQAQTVIDRYGPPKMDGVYVDNFLDLKKVAKYQLAGFIQQEYVEGRASRLAVEGPTWFKGYMQGAQIQALETQRQVNNLTKEHANEVTKLTNWYEGRLKSHEKWATNQIAKLQLELESANQAGVAGRQAGIEEGRRTSADENYLVRPRWFVLGLLAGFGPMAIFWVWFYEKKAKPAMQAYNRQTEIPETPIN